MSSSNLSDLFVGAAVKKLSKVDADPKSSNQHEIGTTKHMRSQFLGESERKFTTTFIWMNDNEEVIIDYGYITLYDSRKNKPLRHPEYRMYYNSNEVTKLMIPGDILFIDLRKNQDGELLFIVTPSDSEMERKLVWLFELQTPMERFYSTEFSKDSIDIGFADQIILDEIGIEPQIDDVERLDHIVEQFSGQFPPTNTFSKIARDTSVYVDPVEEPDVALETWLLHEEALFKRLELQIVRKRLVSGFSDAGDADVEGFLKFSLSVQNRRKSRMGHSFEHHLAAIFDSVGLFYERGKITENNQRPDFIFPNIKIYEKLPKNHPILMMLAVKSTCKDRWRQIIPEAEKIHIKNLATLEPSISEKQTEQMAAFNVQLVVPRSIRESYTEKQQSWVWTLAEFLCEVRTRQAIT